MLREIEYKSSARDTLAVAFTGICFLLVLKILRAFAVKSPVGKNFDTAQNRGCFHK